MQIVDRWNKLWEQPFIKGKCLGPHLGLQEVVCQPPERKEPFQHRDTYISQIRLCNKLFQITCKIGTLFPPSLCGSGIQRLSRSSFQGCDLRARVVWGLRLSFLCSLSYWLPHRPAWAGSWKLNQLSPEQKYRTERTKLEGENSNVLCVGDKNSLSFSAKSTH